MAPQFSTSSPSATFTSFDSSSSSSASTDSISSSFTSSPQPSTTLTSSVVSTTLIPPISPSRTIFVTAVMPTTTTGTAVNSGTESSRGSNTGIIVGSIFGGMALGALIAFFVWVCCARKRRRIATPADPEQRIKDFENMNGPAPPRRANSTRTVLPSTNVRIMNWLARQNSTSSRTSRTTTLAGDSPPEYRTIAPVTSDSASLYSQPSVYRSIPTVSNSLTVVEEAEREPDYVAYDIRHLKH